MKSCIRFRTISVLVVLCVLFLASCDNLWNMRDVHEQRTVTADGIDSIKLTAKYAEVSFTSANRTDIDITLTGSTSADTVLFRADRVGSRLEIECDENRNFGHFRSQLKLIVVIPENSLSSISLENVSGAIDARNLEAGSFFVKTVSGAIQTANLKGALESASTSGSITIDTQDGTVNVRNTSGTITAKKISGKTRATTSSGAITISYANTAYETTANSISGSVEVQIPDGNPFSFSMTSVSGSKNCAFMPGNSSGTIGSGGPSVNLDTTSGAIRIIKL